MFRRAFTMLELIFVIVIMGILAKFGVDLILQTYQTHARTVVANSLGSKVDAALLTITKRLERRVKDSIVVSNGGASGGFVSLSTAAAGTTFEWISVDTDGFNQGNWSGIADIWNTNTASTQLVTPATTAIPPNSAALFVGSDIDPQVSFGWSGAAARDLVPVTLAGLGTLSVLAPVPPTTFSSISEFYQICDTAVGVTLNATNLILGTNYQPWGGGILNANRLLLENVTTFTMRKSGDIIKVRLCASENNFLGEGQYSICKEKVVF